MTNASVRVAVGNRTSVVGWRGNFCMPSELKKMFGDEMRRMLRATVGLAVAAGGKGAGAGAQQARKAVELEEGLRGAARRGYQPQKEVALEPRPLPLGYSARNPLGQGP